MPFAKKQPDKSKRVAYGCTIDKKNIIPGGKTRRRKDFDYKEIKEKEVPRESVNVLEKREKIAKEVFASKKKPTKKVVKKYVRRKANKENIDTNKQEEREEETKKEEKQEEVEKLSQDMSNVQIRSRTPKGKRRRSVRKEQKPLSEAVMKQIERLGGKYVSKSKRCYHKQKYEIPEPMQYFCDHKFPGLKNAEYDIENIEFNGEFALDESNEWLDKNSDGMLIGDGDVLIAVKQKDTKQDMADFDVYIIDDAEEELQVEGPIKLSQFLAGCEKL